MRIRLAASAVCLLSASVATQACNKKKNSSPTTDATGTNAGAPSDVDSAVVTADTKTLKLAGSLNLIVGNDGASLALADIGGDYAADQGHFNTDDKSLGALGSVQTILCFLAATGYSDEHVVNKGKYVAMVDMSKCDKEGGGGGGNGSTAKTVKMTQVVVDSTRADKKPLMAKAWFDLSHGDEDDSKGKQRIAMSIVVAEGPGSANPLGIFRLVFLEGLVGNDGNYTAIGHGSMEAKRDSTGAVVLNFIEKNDMSSGGESSKQDSAVGVKIAVQDGKVVGGWASLHDYQTQKGGGHGDSENKVDFRIAFDRSLFAAHDQNASTNADVCRNQSDFNMNVWNYGVYDAATGNHVALKGGFGFTYGDGGNKRGWASYYGVSGEVGGAIADGTKVTKQDFGNKAASGETFTIKVGKGKLTKHTRHALSLSDLDGLELQAGGMDGSQKRIVYSKALSKFQVTGTASGNGYPISWTDTTATDYTPGQGFNNYFSGALGGRVDVAFDANNKAIGAAFYEDQDVTGTAGKLNLYCWQNCIKANLKASYFANTGGGGDGGGNSGPGSGMKLDGNNTGGNNNTGNNTGGNNNGGGMTAPGYLYAADATNPYAAYALASPKAYTFDSATLMLSSADGPIALDSGEKLSGGGFIPSLDLVDEAGKGKVTDPTRAREQDVTYTWSIGDPANPWTAYQGLIDASGKPVVFDAPRIIAYTHTAANDATGNTSSPLFGKTLRLQYDGSNLQIPGHQDKDTGYYVADFAIKEGVKSDDGSIVFKPLDGSKYMKSKDIASCSSAGLDPGKAPSLPEDSLFDDSKANHDAVPDATSLPIQVVNGAYVGG